MKETPPKSGQSRSRTIRLSWALVSAALALAVGFAAGAIAATTAGGSGSSVAGGAAPTDSGPGATEAIVGTNPHYLSGSAASRVTVVEFTDYQCPWCARMAPVLERLASEYGNDVAIVPRHFPLDFHANAPAAGRAVEAAHLQGAFKTMSTMIYERQENWKNLPPSEAANAFASYATELGLDPARFDADFAAAATLKAVTDDKAAGEKLGVRGTPTIFIQGKTTDARSYPELKTLIDRALAR